MPDNTLHHLDFFKLLNLVKPYLLTSYADDDLVNLRPFYDLEKIKERQDILQEFYDVITQFGKPPLAGIPDIRDVLKRLSVGNSVLDPKEFLLLQDFLSYVQGLISYLKKLPKKGRYLTYILGIINPLTEVERKIKKTINREGFVEDSASYELLEIRRELHVKRTKIKKYLEKLMESDRFRSLLQDTYITIRNGRYVLPMKPNFNQAIDGIVHDYSHTLKTSFVEPIECVSLNNEINVLEKREKEEEERILRELTSYVNTYLGSLHRHLEVVKEVDFFCGLSLFSIDFGCVRPEVTENGDLYIKNAVNPLLRTYKGDATVPIDIILEEEKKVLIISGPNAGGKTVALKTIGLLLLMAYSGMFIPASINPKIPLYKRIYALVGDEQDFSKDLSSFTSHVITIKNIYQESSGGELILIDEIGGGTDPQEASALSMGIMDAFAEKGCKLVVTTHLGHLKGYGFTKEFAKNAACEYDPVRMVPLYKLTYGTVGMSNALNVAKNVGFPDSILEKSIRYLGEQEYMMYSIFDALRKKEEELAREREEILQVKLSLKNKLRRIEEKKEEIIKRFEERYKNKIEILDERIREIEREVSKKEKVSVKRAKEILNEVKRESGIDKKEQEDKPLKVGDFVKIKNLGSVGYISDLEDSSGECEVVIGNIRTRIGKEKLIKIDRVEERVTNETTGVKVTSEKVDVWKLNLRGMKVEEAIECLDRFMDRAVLNGVNKVTILHGIGTGKLMLKVREYLSQSKYVSNFKLDEKNPGITVVELT
ncbi:MAG: Smr/MutS family protein [Deltaproteobacteria bacterium]|nr:Smr/MutS family protein [Deltaproteobacteria bacterium]